MLSVSRLADFASDRSVDGWRRLTFDAIRHHGRLKRYRRKEFVFVEGQSSEAVYGIESGLIEMSGISPTGREVAYSLRIPLEPFGFSEIILGEARNRSAVAHVDCQLWVLERSAFLSLLGDQPEVLYALLASTLHRFSRSNQMRAVLRGRPADERVAYTLLTLAKQVLQVPATYDDPVLNVTHDDIGRLCDISRQTVTMVLDDLRAHGIVELRSRAVIVRDLTALEERVCDLTLGL